MGEHHTNNEAEYSAAILALQRILQRREVRVAVQMDSMLVCKQLRGEWRIKQSHLKCYFREAIALLQLLKALGYHITLQHIHREHNKDADACANRGADGIDASEGW